MKDLTDKQLIEQILLTNNMKHWGELYDRYADKVYRKCIAMVKDKDIAQDLAQDIMLKAMLGLSTFKQQSSFFTWIYRITYNHCISFLRKQQRIDKKLILNVDLNAAPDHSVGDLEDKRNKEISLNQLENAFEHLREDEKALLLMKYQDSLSIKEIQSIMQLSESVIKMRLHRARLKLKKLYKKIYRYDR